MHHMHQMFLRSALLLPALSFSLVLPANSYAQQSEAAAAPQVTVQPWLYENSDIPIDTAWTFGVLDNGLRYAVRNNGVPPGQVSIRIRIDAGSLMENDNEQGVAHFMEHLTFRESKYVPDGDAIKIWQRFGVTFGSDSNAETTPTQTVFKLDLPNATPAILDESMKILSGMIREPGLSKKALDAERPIVLAELRERSGAQARISDATRSLFFAGQRLAVRSPIGKPETLNAATPKRVRAFHDRWYRPENVVISIAGDVDPATLERMVKQYYADWRVTGRLTPQPDFGAPSDKGPVADVLVEPGVPLFVSYGIMRPWFKVNDTIVYNQQLLIDLLSQQLLNRRLESRARAGGNFLQAGVNQDDVSRSADTTFVSIVPLGDNWQAALQDVRGVIADATTNAPTQEEIDREIIEIDAAFAVGAETANTEAGSKQADDIVNAVDIRETVATAATALGVFRDMRPLITPQRVLDATKALFSGPAKRALLVGPDEIPGAKEELATLMQTEVAADAGARIADSSFSFDQLPPLGAPGTLVNAEDIRLLGMEIVTLSNGVKALLYANDAEVSKVQVKVRFGKGYQAFAPNAMPSIWAANAALVAGGVGDFGQEELDRLTTGRRIGFGFQVDNDAFEFSADTRPVDLHDQLRLFASKLAFPRWDSAPVVRAKAGTKLAYSSYGISPQSVLERDLQYLLHDRDKRWKTADPAEVDSMTPDAFKAEWAPLLQSGPIEVMLFGDFERDTAIAYLNDTFGALPPRTLLPPVAGADTISFPAPTPTPEVLRHNGDKNQAAAIIAWPTGGGLANIRESRQLEILSSLINNRLFDQLRDAAGASYSPQVSNSWPEEFSAGGNIMAISQLEPASIPKFYQIVEGIVADLAAKPVAADELNRITEPLRQLISRASTGNAFWLSQLEGATQEPAKIAALRTILGDYTMTTPQAMQVLAQKYLVRDKAWKLIVLPEGAPLPK